MANTDAPFGFRPVRHLSGGVIRNTEYPMSTGIDSIGKGDPVTLNQGKVVLATAGVRVMGIFDGFRAVKSDGSIVYDQYYASGSLPAARELTAFVYDDPNIVYEAQADDDTTPLPTTGSGVGQNLDSLTVAADATTKNSRVELDASSLTTGAAQYRLWALAQKPSNEWGGNCVVEVTINEFIAGATGITGVS